MLIKMHINVLKPSNISHTLSVTQWKTLQKCGCRCTLQTVLDMHGIVVKFTSSIFLPMEDCKRTESV